MGESTYWNGEKCKAQKVNVIVGKATKPTYWYAGLVGTCRPAVLVVYHGTRFFLDDKDGQAWLKVTVGRGSPRYGHLQLPDDCSIVHEGNVND